MALIVAATVDRDQAERGLHHDTADDDLTDPLLPGNQPVMLPACPDHKAYMCGPHCYLLTDTGQRFEA